MLRSLKDLFDTLLAPPQAQPAAQLHRLHLACAVLLVEVMRADRELGQAEHQAVIGALQREFALADDEVARLVELAHETSRGATDLHAFTSALNAQLDDALKLRLVQSMWQVAFADGHLEAHEQHLLWRIADLLHVPHRDYIAAKMQARAAAPPRGADSAG